PGDEVGSAHRASRRRSGDIDRRQLRRADRDDAGVDVWVAGRPGRRRGFGVRRLRTVRGIDRGLAGSVVVAHPHSFFVDSSTPGSETRIALGREITRAPTYGRNLLLTRVRELSLCIDATGCVPNR